MPSTRNSSLCCLCGVHVLRPLDVLVNAQSHTPSLWQAQFRSVCFSRPPDKARSTPPHDQADPTEADLHDCWVTSPSFFQGSDADVSQPDVDWNGYRQRQAWEQLQLQQPRAFAVHEQCWQFLLSAMSCHGTCPSSRKQQDQQQQQQQQPVCSTSAAASLQNILERHRGSGPPPSSERAAAPSPAAAAASTSSSSKEGEPLQSEYGECPGSLGGGFCPHWLRAFVTRWCFGVWAHLHWRYVGERERWRRTRYRLVNQRVWAELEQHVQRGTSMAVLLESDELERAVQRLVLSRNLEAEWFAELDRQRASAAVDDDAEAAAAAAAAAAGESDPETALSDVRDGGKEAEQGDLCGEGMEAQGSPAGHQRRLQQQQGSGWRWAAASRMDYLDLLRGAEERWLFNGCYPQEVLEDPAASLPPLMRTGTTPAAGAAGADRACSSSGNGTADFGSPSVGPHHYGLASGGGTPAAHSSRGAEVSNGSAGCAWRMQPLLSAPPAATGGAAEHADARSDSSDYSSSSGGSDGGLSMLPDDVIRSVLLQLSPADVYRFRAGCRRLRGLQLGPREWRALCVGHLPVSLNGYVPPSAGLLESAGLLPRRPPGDSGVLPPVEDDEPDGTASKQQGAAAAIDWQATHGEWCSRMASECRNGFRVWSIAQLAADVVLAQESG